MTVEYVLLLALFAFFILNALVGGPQKTFKEAAPRLGARIENHLTTGDAFIQPTKTYPQGNRWIDRK
jgi:hypothetical protein